MSSNVNGDHSEIDSSEDSGLVLADKTGSEVNFSPLLLAGIEFSLNPNSYLLSKSKGKCEKCKKVFELLFFSKRRVSNEPLEIKCINMRT